MKKSDKVWPLIASLAFFVSSMLLVFADIGPPNDLIEIQGAKVISEGGYFNFYIKNVCEHNITVSLLNYTDSDVFLYPNDTVTYKVVAPEINLLCENVVYVFRVTSLPMYYTTDYSYTVTVVSNDFVQQYQAMAKRQNTLVLLLIVTTGICIFIGTSFLVEQLWKLVLFLKRKK